MVNYSQIYIIAFTISVIYCDIIPKQYIINLDNHPNERWKEVAVDFKNESSYVKSILL